MIDMLISLLKYKIYILNNNPFLYKYKSIANKKLMTQNNDSK